MIQQIFTGKTVLVTGHTGFKGSWLCAWLKELGANVVGLALDPPTTPSHFLAAHLSNGMSELRIDIRDKEAVEDGVVGVQPDFVFHLAAQALVRKSYQDPVVTWQTNLLGTVNILEALRRLHRPCFAVFITSDKCYDNVEWVWGYRETDALGGPDPYSASKGAAELAIKSYSRSYFPANSKIRLASARAGNVIGGGDWAADRIVPDCVRAWADGLPVTLRSPHATRPWQHVLEPLGGYLRLAAELASRSELSGQAFNFGPTNLGTETVLDLVKEMAQHWKQVRWNLVEDTMSGAHESTLLKLNCDKALFHLGWHAVLTFQETVRITAEWYRSYYEDSAQCGAVTRRQISLYSDLFLSRLQERCRAGNAV